MQQQMGQQSPMQQGQAVDQRMMEQGGQPGQMQQGPEGQPMPEIDGEELQMLMMERVGTLSPPEMQVLDSIITPQTVPVLFKLFPELGILFEQGSQIQAYMQQQGGQQPQGQPQMQQQQMQQQGQPQQQANPLINDEVSAGLMR